MVRGPGRRGSVRKGRGRTKPVASSTSVSPKEKQAKFQGRLSHRTPTKMTKPIEEYFTPICPLTTDNKNSSPQTENGAITTRSSPRKQQPVAANGHHVNGNGILMCKLNGLSPSGHTPHKIQLCEDTSASSTLDGDLRKQNKPKPKLNPSLEHDKNHNEAGKNASVTAKPRTLGEKTENTCHKLTEYFPVRRSVRKTKKTVLEEEQRNLEDCVLSQKEDGLQVMNFEGKGRGVVTTRKFHRGEFVVEYCGELIDMATAKAREEDYSQDQNTGCYMYYFKYKNNQYCIDATSESGRLGRLVNHSRSGNLTTKITSVCGQPRLVLIARDDIEPDQEVCYDYGDRTKESLKFHPWLAS